MMQEELFEAHGMPAPTQLQTFIELLAHTTPVQAGVVIQEEADDLEDIMPSDQELDSGDEAETRGGASTSARAQRVQRRSETVKQGKRALQQGSSSTHFTEVAASEKLESTHEPETAGLSATGISTEVQLQLADACGCL